MSEEVVSVNDLHYVYLQGTPLEMTALRGANLHAYKGEIVGLTGRSGAGKSTLTLHCNGLLRPRRRGVVRMVGLDLADPKINLRSLRQRVGMVFQHPERQLFERLVGDDIAFGPRQMGMARQEVRERVVWAMSAVGLEFTTFVNRPTAALSGGERRKVALAGVLALRPDVLVLDEAMAGLDPLAKEETWSLLRRLNEDEGLTIIIVSSDMEELAELTHRIHVMADGRTVMEGRTAEVFACGDEITALGLGQPTTSAALHQLRQRGYDVNPGAMKIDEAVGEICRILPA